MRLFFTFNKFGSTKQEYFNNQITSVRDKLLKPLTDTMDNIKFIIQFIYNTVILYTDQLIWFTQSNFLTIKGSILLLATKIA